MRRLLWRGTVQEQSNATGLGRECHREESGLTQQTHTKRPPVHHGQPCRSLYDDHIPKGGPVDARIVFTLHDASRFEAGFLIHHSPQAYYRPDLLGPTSIFLNLPTHSWSLIQKPRTMLRHSGIYTLVCVYWNHRFSGYIPSEFLI